MKEYDELNDELHDNAADDGLLDVPTIDEALELLINVRDKQNKESFKKAVHLYNYARVAVTEEQLLAMCIICETYQIGAIIFI